MCSAVEPSALLLTTFGTPQGMGKVEAEEWKIARKNAVGILLMSGYSLRAGVLGIGVPGNGNEVFDCWIVERRCS